MQTVFSTEGLNPRNGFRLWRDLLGERLVPIEVERLDDQVAAAEDGRLHAMNSVVSFRKSASRSWCTQ